MKILLYNYGNMIEFNSYLFNIVFFFLRDIRRKMMELIE